MPLLLSVRDGALDEPGECVHTPLSSSLLWGGKKVVEDQVVSPERFYKVSTAIHQLTLDHCTHCLKAWSTSEFGGRNMTG